MKSVMILGAGVMQVPLIRKAKVMGYRTVVVGSPGPYPGIPLADKMAFEDFKDARKVAALARDEAIEGICTCGIDLPVRAMAEVSEALGLPGISEEAGRVVTNKLLMKEKFARNGVRTARFAKALNLSDGLKALGEIGLPVIFKAVDSQGSAGIVKVERKEQAAYAYDCVRMATGEDYFLVEEFLQGEEFGAQAFVMDGDLQFVLPHGDYVYQGDTGVPIGHFVPAGLDADTGRDCEEQLRASVKAIGLETCAINADFILSRGSVYVLEIGARSGATMLAETVSLYYGFDYYEKILRACVGERVDFTPASRVMPNATMTLLSERDGIIRSLENHNPPDPAIVEIVFDHPVGTRVRRFKQGRDRLGHVIVTGTTPEKAKARLAQALENIRIEVE